jgi:hypothetical protein
MAQRRVAVVDEDESSKVLFVVKCYFYESCL